jgi:hypothetical protein
MGKVGNLPTDEISQNKRGASQMTYAEKLRGIANSLEDLRVEMYQTLTKQEHFNEDDMHAMKELSDSLFSLQSQIRDNVVTVEYLDFN